MEITLPISFNLALKITSGLTVGMSYPTGRIQKGLILLDGGEELCEEAVGFGVPILKCGLQSIFPGELELTTLNGNFTRGVHAIFKLNLEEKIAKTGSGTINNRILYGSKNILAASIRRWPFIRGLLTHTSNLLRARLGLVTTYEPADFSTYLSLTYSIDPSTGRIKVELDKQDPFPSEISEVILMNEQGARHFDQYRDTDGISVRGKEIGCWDQVTAAEASFISPRRQISFSLPQVSGARLYRGRELIGKRLAWSGFGYSFPPNLEHFKYVITIKRLT